MDGLTNLKCDYNIASAEHIARWTDKYFTKTRQVIEAEEKELGHNINATYAIFIRQPVVFAPAIMLTWLQTVAKTNGYKFEVDLMYNEGQQIRAGEPMMFIKGRMSELVELETHYLQKIGPCSVAAFNAKHMAKALPNSKFLAMDVRHAAGMEMAEMMAYAASVGSKAAQADGAKGFIGNATDATAHFFGQEKGFGTMPHALIGAYPDTLAAAEAYHKTFPDEALTVLVDYHGLEVTDSIKLAKRFPDLMEAGKLNVRIDTNGARYLEGLDPEKSQDVIERSVPEIKDQNLSDDKLDILHGRGVSAAAIWHLRNELNAAGANKINIIASSGFNIAKCEMMHMTRAPIDVVGTGSFIPSNWPKTYATSDIIAYEGIGEGDVQKIKVGRKYLIDRYNTQKPVMTLQLG